MSLAQTQILLILAGTVALFVHGRWRHDVVALGALLACVLVGLVPASDAFLGFGQPAVVTVACVLVLSQGLVATGVVDALARRVIPTGRGAAVAIPALCLVGAVMSAFINNVGAMALLMPVAIQLASRHGLPPGRVLMPLAFATILGGMTTLIGTPPNLIVSAFRAEAGSSGFAMFDFAPVGLAVAGAGIAFVTLVGWRLVPCRSPQGAEGFDTGTYLTEARVVADGKAVGKTLAEVEEQLQQADAQIVGLVRNELHIPAAHPRRILRADDILVIEAEPESLVAALSGLGLELAQPLADTDAAVDSAGDDRGDADAAEAAADKPAPRRKRDAHEVAVQELVVTPRSRLIDRSADGVGLRSRFGVNLLAISRQGRRSIKRLRSTRIRAGDVLLMQGPPDTLAGFAGTFACLPLAERTIRIPRKDLAALAATVLGAAVAAATFGLLPAAIAFAAGVVVFVAARIVPAREMYEAIDWSVIVLLGALIPVAGAMASTGAADLVARLMLDTLAVGKPAIALAILLIATMTLSDFMNNAATAAVMCPVAISTAARLQAEPDAFLMAVAVGASCAFLTPIGHQNNTLILGPGGFRFGDYWRLGLPVEILVVAIGVPMLLLVWPL